MCWNSEGKEEYSSLIVYFRKKKAKMYRLCSRNYKEHIQVALSEWVPYSFFNIICIFLHAIYGYICKEIE